MLSEGQAYYADIKSRARRLGRDPDKISILPGIFVIAGATEADAWRRKKELDELAGEDKAILRFARRLGLDPGDIDPDKPMPLHLIPRIDPTIGTGFLAATVALLKDQTLTVREIIARGGGAHRLVVGAPEQIAATMEHWADERAADGFNIHCDVFPTGLESFVDHVVPELQRRGRFRREYEGSTLRDHYGLPRPPSRHAARSAEDVSRAAGARA